MHSRDHQGGGGPPLPGGACSSCGKSTRMTDRVLVTGLGVISPLGTNIEAYWEGLLRTESVPEVSRRIQPHYMANRLMYQVPDQAVASHSENIETLGRASDFAIRATAMALQDAGLADRGASWRVGTSIGSGMGDHDLLDAEREGGPQVDGQAAFFFKV